MNSVIWGDMMVVSVIKWRNDDYYDNNDDGLYNNKQ